MKVEVEYEAVNGWWWVSERPGLFNLGVGRHIAGSPISKEDALERARAVIEKRKLSSKEIVTLEENPHA